MRLKIVLFPGKAAIKSVGFVISQNRLVKASFLRKYKLNVVNITIKAKLISIFV